MSRHLNPRRAVYVGSFDPLTLGHLDIIRRGAKIFDQLMVGIGVNPDKEPLFTTAERVLLLESVLRDFKHVHVESFSGLTVDFAEKCGAAVMLRGIRTLSDIEAEFTMLLANRVLVPDIETVFLMANEKYTHISSTLIKQIAQLGTSSSKARLKEFVPEPVVDPLLAKFHR